MSAIPTNKSLTEATSTLRVRLLGPPSIELGARSLETQLGVRALALFSYLLVNQRTHTRDDLATLFWDNMPSIQARKNLRNIVPNLRNVLDSSFIITHQTIAFNQHTACWLDTLSFSDLLSAPLDQVDTHQLWEAVGLYQGDFLQGFGVRHAPQFEEWMLMERERFRALMHNTLTVLITRHISQHNYYAGVAATRRLLELDPLNETAHQQQMVLLALQGRRDMAQVQYDVCCNILKKEFGMQPLPETTALHHAIQAGNLDDAWDMIPRGVGEMSRNISAIPSVASSPVVTDPQARFAFPTNHMCITPDGRLLAESVHSPTIALWDIRSGDRYALLTGHEHIVTALAAGGSGSGVLASGSSDGSIFVWDVARGTLRFQLDGHSVAINVLAFAPDGTLLASGSSDGMIFVWDVATGTLWQKLHGHDSSIRTIVFSPEQDTLVSGSAKDHSHNVRVWCLHTGNCLSVVECGARTR